jgi:hypothetical protein
MIVSSQIHIETLTSNVVVLGGEEVEALEGD